MSVVDSCDGEDIEYGIFIDDICRTHNLCDMTSTLDLVYRCLSSVNNTLIEVTAHCSIRDEKSDIDSIKSKINKMREEIVNKTNETNRYHSDRHKELSKIRSVVLNYIDIIKDIVIAYFICLSKKMCSDDEVNYLLNVISLTILDNSVKPNIDDISCKTLGGCKYLVSLVISDINYLSKYYDNVKLVRLIDIFSHVTERLNAWSDISVIRIIKKKSIDIMDYLILYRRHHDDASKELNGLYDKLNSDINDINNNISQQEELLTDINKRVCESRLLSQGYNKTQANNLSLIVIDMMKLFMELSDRTSVLRSLKSKSQIIRASTDTKYKHIITDIICRLIELSIPNCIVTGSSIGRSMMTEWHCIKHKIEEQIIVSYDSTALVSVDDL